MFRRKKIASGILLVLAMLHVPGSCPAFADPDSKNQGLVETGYAIVTPTSPSASDLVVFETFGHKQGNETSQAGVLPATMTTSAVLFVNASGRLSRNLGVAVANPGNSDVTVTMTVRNDAGVQLGTRDVVVRAHSQTAEFVTQMFENTPAVPQDLTGTLSLTSTAPVAIIGLRFRGENFSTIPITNLSPAAAVPAVASGIGGPGSVILPHFAVGGGWASEIVLANTGTAFLTVRVDLFKQDGSPFSATLNGQTGSSFTEIVVPAGGVVTLAPKDNRGDGDF